MKYLALRTKEKAIRLINSYYEENKGFINKSFLSSKKICKEEDIDFVLEQLESMGYIKYTNDNPYMEYAIIRTDKCITYFTDKKENQNKDMFARITGIIAILISILSLVWQIISSFSQST